MQHQQIPIHVKTRQAAKLPVLPTYCSTLKMDAIAPLKSIYQTTWSHVQADCNIDTYCQKPQTLRYFKCGFQPVHTNITL
jgi:hypothetical protein